MLQDLKKKKHWAKRSPNVAACELSYTVFIKLGVLLVRGALAY